MLYIYRRESGLVAPPFWNYNNLHLTYLPIIGEIKTKLAQNSLSLMRSVGFPLDILICRHELLSDMSNAT